MARLTVSRVVLSRDVAHVCLSHALSTEHQEIMGLLLGRVVLSEVHITRSLVLSRKDRQRDRVEVGDELVALSSTVSEKLSSIDCCEENVVGWYHSHPHITAMPSHVDVKTQGNYQQLDSAFVGLIFSVFDNGRCDICAFQSKLGSAGEWSREEVPLVVMEQKCALEGVAALQQVILNEEMSVLVNLPSSSSMLEKCRRMCVYQCAMLRIMDQQLLPTLQALRSRRRSLEQQLHTLSTATEPGYIRTGEAASQGREDRVEALLRATESLTYEWTGRSTCLQLIFAGVIVSVEDDPGAVAAGLCHSEKYVLTVVPSVSPDLWPPASRTHTRCSPWVAIFQSEQAVSGGGHNGPEYSVPRFALLPSDSLTRPQLSESSLRICLCPNPASEGVCSPVTVTVSVMGAAYPESGAHLTPAAMGKLIREFLNKSLHLDTYR